MVIVRHFANQVVLLSVLENVRILVKQVAQTVVHVNVGIHAMDNALIPVEGCVVVDAQVVLMW